MEPPISSSRAAALLLLAAALALVATPRPARAEADDAAKQAARDKLTEGIELMKKGDAGTALARFEEAYKLVPSPKIFFNIGLAREALGQKVEALTAFQRFVDEVTDPNPAALAKAQQEIAVLKPQLGAISVVCKAQGAALRLDGDPLGVAPLAKPLIYVAPGEHTLSASAAGREATRKIDVHAGEQVEASLDPGAVAPAPAATPPPLLVPPAVLTAPPPPETAAPSSAGAALGGAPTATVQAAPAEPGARPAPGTTPVYRKLWFWGVVAGAAVVAGTVAILAAGQSTTYPTATMGTIKGN
jgi:hypothetical protein